MSDSGEQDAYTRGRFNLAGNFPQRLYLRLRDQWANVIGNVHRRSADGNAAHLRTAYERLFDTESLFGTISLVCGLLGGLAGLAFGAGLAFNEGFGVLGWVTAPLIFTGLGVLLGGLIPGFLVAGFYIAVVFGVISVIWWLWTRW